MTDQVDAAILADNVIFFIFHDVEVGGDVNASAQYSITTTRLQGLSDYLDTNSGSIEVMTMTEYYEAVNRQIRMNGLSVSGLTIN
jgi:hypothetical protein